MVPVLRWILGTWSKISIKVEADADGVVFNLPPDKIVTVHGEEEKPVLLDMRGRLERIRMRIFLRYL